MALQTRPQVGRPAYDPFSRRYDLYVKAVPVFRTFGYRQVTLKALAHACGLSAPALYRYFPSKLEFALFPLGTPPTGHCATMLRRAAEAHADPLRGLRAALEAALEEVDLIVLGLRLALEAGRDVPDLWATRDLDGFEQGLSDVMLRCVPGLGDGARDLAHMLTSLVISAAATNDDVSPDVVLRRGITVVRAYCVAAGVDALRFDEVFGGATA